MAKTVQKIVFIVGGMFCFLLWAYLWFYNIDGIQRGVFFGDTNDWFMDFYNPIYATIGKTPYTWGNPADRASLPLTYMLLYPLTVLYPYIANADVSGVWYIARYSQLMAIMGAAYLVVSFGCLFYCLYKACGGGRKEVEKLGILAVLFCSGITIFGFDRANTIIISTALNCVFFLTYDSQRKYMKHIGFICLAVSAVLKLFPALFGVLLLYKKRYKDALFTILYGVVLAFLPFFWVEGNIVDNILAFIHAVKSHTEVYAGGTLGLSAPTIFTKGNLNIGILPIIVCILAVVVAKDAKNEWKQILLLSLAIVLTSGQQAWYCLVALFYPIVLFLNESESNEKIRWAFLAGFIMILSPLQFNFNIGSLLFSSRRVINTVCVIMYIYLIIDSGIAFVKNYMRARIA